MGFEHTTPRDKSGTLRKVATHLQVISLTIDGHAITSYNEIPITSPGVCRACGRAVKGV